jgi:hypothetical protein
MTDSIKIHVNGSSQRKLDIAAADRGRQADAPSASLIRFTTTSEELDVSSPIPGEESVQSYKVHVDAAPKEMDRLAVPSNKRPPSLLRQASTNVSMALDRSNIFPPEPKHEDDSLVPHCTFRGCIIAAWIMVTLICFCLIAVGIAVSAQSKEIAEQEKQASMFGTFSSTGVDGCNDYSSDCAACLSRPSSENCVWVYSTVAFSEGQSIENAGVSVSLQGMGQHSCVQHAYSPPFGGYCPWNGGQQDCKYQAISPNPAGTCDTQGEQSPTMSAEELQQKTLNCRNWAGDDDHTCLSPSGPCAGALSCCGELGHLDNSFDQQPGQCVSNVAYCTYDEESDTCQVITPSFG